MEDVTTELTSASLFACANHNLTDIPPQRPPRLSDHPNPTKITQNTHFSTTHNSTIFRPNAPKFEIQKDIMLNNCFVIWHIKTYIYKRFSKLCKKVYEFTYKIHIF